MRCEIYKIPHQRAAQLISGQQNSNWNVASSQLTTMLAHIVKKRGASLWLMRNAARTEAKFNTSPSRMAVIAILRSVNLLWLLIESNVLVQSSTIATTGGERWSFENMKAEGFERCMTLARETSGCSDIYM